MVLGAALLIGALSLFIWNQREATEAEEAAAEVLPQLIEVIEQQQTAVLSQSATALTTTPAAQESMPEQTAQVVEPEMPSTDTSARPVQPTQVKGTMKKVQVAGNAYIGYLSIPKLGLELPVMADWSYKKLRKAPCHYSGGTDWDNLVIMAHNYRRHFGRLKELSPGDAVYFVDMDGESIHYEVVGLDVLSPRAVSEITSGNYDLTLFTCTYGGQSRVALGCDRAAE